MFERDIGMENQDYGRREFLRGTARYGLLSLVVGLAVWNSQKDSGRLGGEACVNEGICKGCSVFAGCGLPAALSARNGRAGG